jgi:23S rRNA pseudouridine2457 synthase
LILAFHKPYGVLSQFTPDGSANRPLSDFAFPKNVYPIGRLDRKTLRGEVRVLHPQPAIPPRDPPVRLRKSVEDFWIELRIREGRNRQVRRMTAAVGHPTLRLIRTAIGALQLGDLPPGNWLELDSEERRLLLESVV